MPKYVRQRARNAVFDLIAYRHFAAASAAIAKHGRKCVAWRETGTAMTLLLKAVEQGHVALCAQLIALGADMNAISVVGGRYTCAMLAVAECRLDVLRLLHASGADLNFVNGFSTCATPLGLALAELQIGPMGFHPPASRLPIALWLIHNPDVDLLKPTRFYFGNATPLAIARDCRRIPELAHALEAELIKRRRWSRLRTAWFAAAAAAAAR